MYAKEQATQEVLTSLKKAIGKGFTIVRDDLDTPPDASLGDLAFPCFELAKGEGKNPAEIARELAAKIGPTDLIETIQAVGPYVNFTFKNEAFAAHVLEDVRSGVDRYGTSKLGVGTKVLVEYAQPNTHKVLHVGHLRNVALGQSVVNILRANGYEVIPASYIGDSGADVAKTLWGLKKFHDGEEPPKDDRANWLGGIYVEATKYLADHPEVKEEISEVQQQLEAREEPWYSLWKETRQWSLDGFKAAFAELGVKPEVWYFESEVEQDGKQIVQKLLTDGVAKKSQGATIIDLEDEDLGAFLVLKSDGTTLYSTWDLALALKKEKDHAPDRQLFVVDMRQSLHFKQLFATLKRMGFTPQLTHLSYDLVSLPEGTMSSRAGTIAKYDDLKDTMISRLEEETRKRHEDWDDKKVTQTAKTIAISSMLFMMLRQDPNSIITFDLEEALSFDGFTGPYLQYTVARIESIKKKTKVKPKADASKLSHALEHELIRKLAEYPAVVERAGKAFHVSLVAQWAFETAKVFAEYYHEVRVIDEEDSEMTAARLALIDAVRISLSNGMNLLGMGILKEM